MPAPGHELSLLLPVPPSTSGTLNRKDTRDGRLIDADFWSRDLVGHWARQLQATCCCMCYFLAVGAVTEPWRFASLLEDELRPEVDAVVPTPSMSANFPQHDAVRVLLKDGCSCSLLEPATRLPVGIVPTADAVWLAPTNRKYLAALARRFGGMRVCVHRRRRGLDNDLPRTAMPIDAFLDARTGLPVGVLIDVASGS